MDTFVDFVKFSLDMNAPLFIFLGLVWIALVSKLFWTVVEYVNYKLGGR